MRLNLNWTIDDPQEREKFVREYIEEHGHLLTEENLSTLADYILWATKDPNIEMETKNSPWVGKNTSKEVSLDALKEQAEETGRPVEALLSATNFTNPIIKLNRTDVINKLLPPSVPFFQYKNTPSSLNKAERLDYLEKEATKTLFLHLKEGRPTHPLTSQWLDLWRDIDTTEYTVQTWEMQRGKRRPGLPIRDILEFRVSVLSDDPISFKQGLQEKASQWSAYEVLKNKRLLVSFRKQQYALLDGLGEEMRQAKGGASFWTSNNEGIAEFYPIMDEKLFIKDFLPSHFDPSFQGKVITALQRCDRKEEGNLTIDLRDGKSVRALLSMQGELADSLPIREIAHREIIGKLLFYLHIYLKEANLSPDLLTIMQMKIKKKSNREIAEFIQEEYGFSYRENYISTIYTKRIIDAITEQAEKHVRKLEYLLMGRNVFKTCSRCHGLFPRNGEYFNKRNGTSDGFYNYCKECRIKQRKK